MCAYALSHLSRPRRLQWTVLPRPLFVQLYRQDFVGSNLFRNFLLADRLMRSFGCVPGSHPALPRTHDHPLWAAWDYAVDATLAQLPSLTGFSSGDLLRMAALGLAPDVSRLGGAAWGDMVPPQLQPPPALPVSPAAAGGSSVRRSSSTPRGGGGRRASMARTPSSGARGSLAGTLTPFDLSALPTDPLTLPLSESASATAGERLAILRRRLQGVVSATSMGPAPRVAPVGLAAFRPSTFFDEQVRARACVHVCVRGYAAAPPAPPARAQMSAFEVWLWEVSSRLPCRARLRLADAVLDFVESHDASAVAASQLAAAADVAAASGYAGPGAAVLLQHVVLPPPVSLGRAKLRFVDRLTASLTALSIALPSGCDSAAATSPLPGAPAAPTDESSGSHRGARVVVPVLRIRAPAQLPILRQALLLPSLRYRALLLFARFCDLGPEAVNLTLLSGTHDSIFMLLTKAPSPRAPLLAGAPDLAPILVFIWAKVLGVDRASAEGLVQSCAHAFFLEFLERRLDDAAAAEAGTFRRRGAVGNGSLTLTSGSQQSGEPGRSAPPTLSARSEPGGGGNGVGAAAVGGSAAAAPTPIVSSSGCEDVIEGDQTHHALFVLCKVMEENPAGCRACWSARTVRAAARTYFIGRDRSCELNRLWSLLLLRSLAAGAEENRLALLLDGGDLAERGEEESRAARMAAVAAAAAPTPAATTDRSTPIAPPARAFSPSPQTPFEGLRVSTDPEGATSSGAESLSQCWTPATLLLSAAVDDDRTIRAAAALSIAALLGTASTAAPAHPPCAGSGVATPPLPLRPVTQVASALAAHASELVVCRLQVATAGKQSAILSAKLRAAAAAVKPSEGGTDGPVRPIALPANDILAVSASEAYRAAFCDSQRPPLPGAAQNQGKSSVSNSFLRAAWPIAHALVVNSGVQSLPFPARAFSDRDAVAAASRSARRRVLLKAVAQRMKRMLLSAEVVEEDAREMRVALAKKPVSLAPLIPVVTAVRSQTGSGAGLFVVPVASDVVPPGALVPITPAAIAAVVPIPLPTSLPEPAPVTPRLGTSDAAQSRTASMPHSGSTQNFVGLSPGPATPSRAPRAFFPDPTADGEYITEAPPADFLAQALAAGAAAQRVGSVASDLSSAAEESAPPRTRELSVPKSFARLHSQKSSPSRPSMGSPRNAARLHQSNRSSPALVAPAASSAAGAGSSPPRPVVALAADASLTAAAAVAVSPTPAPSGSASVRAAAEARLAAKQATIRRIAALDTEFAALQAAAPPAVREACLTTCIAPLLQDACPSVRREALLGIAAFAHSGPHELGLVVAVAASLVDYAAGGMCLRRALRLSMHPASGRTGQGHGHDHRPPPPPAAAPATQDLPSSSSRAPVARRQDSGNRLRFNLLSRVFGGGSQKSPATPSAEVAAPFPLTRESAASPGFRLPARQGVGSGAGAPQSDFASFGFREDELSLSTVAGALRTASAAFRCVISAPDFGSAASDHDKVDAVSNVDDERIARSWLVAGDAGECHPVLQVSLCGST